MIFFFWSNLLPPCNIGERKRERERERKKKKGTGISKTKKRSPEIEAREIVLRR